MTDPASSVAAAIADLTADLTADFCGVVSVSRFDDVEFERAYGHADRAHGIPNTVDTQFGIASATKGFTALVIAGLIDDGRLTLNTPVRTVLGADLALIDDDVTVEHLLSNTSGIGDYIDEAELEDAYAYVLRVPVHTLADTEGYVAALDGFAQKFPPGARFEYCNSGFVVLALIAERITGTAFHDLVDDRVWRPAGMTSSDFHRMDRLPGTAAVGYLPDGRSNVLHLPVRGNGDGGAFTTVGDFRSFWTALFAGRIVSAERVAQLVAPCSKAPEDELRYGLGFWLAATGPAVLLVGGDAGVSFVSEHDPVSGRTCTVVTNASVGAAPIWRRLGTLGTDRA